MSSVVPGTGGGAFLAALGSAIAIAAAESKTTAAVHRLSTGETSIVMVSPADKEGAAQRRQAIDAKRRTIG
jgi:hypothetical protein